LIDGPNILGIVDFQAGFMVVRVLMKCLPLTQAMQEAAFRYQTGQHFQAAGMPALWIAQGVEVTQPLAKEATTK
jgi:hypothetical protein